MFRENEKAISENENHAIGLLVQLQYFIGKVIRSKINCLFFWFFFSQDFHRLLITLYPKRYKILACFLFVLNFQTIMKIQNKQKTG